MRKSKSNPFAAKLMPTAAVKKFALAFGRAFASPRMFFAALLWLIALLIVGTVSQRYIGLYQSHAKYFASFIFWEGPLPLPGGYAVLALISVGLIARLIFRTDWKRKGEIGVIIIHLGALLLLVGGGLTALTASEGNMVIREGSRSSVVSDYDDLEFALVNADDTNRAAAFAESQIQPGEILRDSSLPFAVEILNFCRNCEIQRLPESDSGRRGFARNFDLIPQTLAKESAENIGGIVFRISGGEAEGVYAVFELMPIEQTIAADGKRFIAVIRRRQTRLPFAVHLIDFVRENHPGTDLARRFRSEVLLIDGGTETRRIIRMNEPLRHRGYTFYQASFIEGETEATVLATVKNAGRIFPYAASVIICLGLLMHMLLRIPRLIREKK